MKLKIEKIDHVYVRVLSEDEGILYELSEFFTYEYPGARFTPQYRAKLWDGKVRMYDIMRKTLYVGLVKYVESFALERGYELEFVNQVITHTDVDIDTVSKFAEWLTPMGHGTLLRLEIINWKQYIKQYMMSVHYCYHQRHLENLLSFILP